MQNRLKLVFSSPLLIIRFFKKSKLDDFVVGVFFGAIFSLIVNIITVRVQETIVKQRVLEALEKEITLHTVMANSVLEEEKRLLTMDKSKLTNDYLTSDLVISKRFNARAWNTTEANKYLLEIDPLAAAEIEGYYTGIIEPFNILLEKNQNDHNELHQACEPFYTLITGKESKDPQFCNAIIINTINLQASIVKDIYKYTNTVKEKFHPTNDRLNSFWLKILLGDQSIEILKNKI